MFFPSAVPENASPVQLRQNFSEEFLKSVWPSNYGPPTELSGMNLEETAVWVQMFCKFKGWPEWESYYYIFKNNGIFG